MVNGLMQREDRDQFMASTTLGLIPAGTGNGLAKSLTDIVGEQYGVLPATFAVIKGRQIKIDLTELELEYHQNEEQKKLYSFLGLAWAIFSDIDINSEAIRCIGYNRFLVWGVYRVLIPR